MNVASCAFVALLIAMTCDGKSNKPNYYMFWKNMVKKHIPNTKALQTIAGLALNSMCQIEKYGEIAQPGCEGFAVKEAEKLQLPISPNKKILNTKNPNKFMKKLIKNTIEVLSSYVSPFTLVSKKFEEENCRGTSVSKTCLYFKNINEQLEVLINNIIKTMKDFFGFKGSFSPKHSKNIPSDTLQQHLAVVYGLVSELKETEAALDYIVKTTWDVHVTKASKPTNGRKENDLDLY